MREIFRHSEAGFRRNNCVYFKKSQQSCGEKIRKAPQTHLFSASLGKPGGHSFGKEGVIKIENNLEQYKALLGSASEVAEACLDVEGGTFFLAWVGELVQDLAGKVYCRSARSTTQKLCEAVGVDWECAECDESAPAEKQAWLNLFAEALMNHVMSGSLQRYER